MSDEKSLLKKLNDKVDKLAYSITNNNIEEISNVVGNTRKLIWKNLLAGISRGVGMAIGFTILAAILILFLQKIVLLNIPVIGQYISDIAEIVEENIHGIRP